MNRNEALEAHRDGLIHGLLVGSGLAREAHGPRLLRASADDLERRFPADPFILGLARAYRIRAAEIEDVEETC